MKQQALITMTTHLSSSPSRAKGFLDYLGMGLVAAPKIIAGMRGDIFDELGGLLEDVGGGAASLISYPLQFIAQYLTQLLIFAALALAALLVGYLIYRKCRSSPPMHPQSIHGSFFDVNNA